LRLGVLGRVQLLDAAGHHVELSVAATKLLAVVVVADGSPIALDRVPVAIASLLTAAEELNGLVEVIPTGCRLVVGPGDEIDAQRFVQLCAQAANAAPLDRIAVLTEALALWRGDAYEDFARESWAEEPARALDTQRVVAVEDLAESLIAAGDAAHAIELLEPHVRAHPYRERPVALVVTALAREHQPRQAWAHLQRFGRDARSIGAEPSSQLRDLTDQLLGGLDPPRNIAANVAGPLPSGTVTFMFTDIEGSTQRWQDDDRAMADALSTHDQTIRTVVERHSGFVFKHTGDGVCAVFSSAPAAVAAAMDAQSLLQLPVRIGLHTGEAESREGDYFGPTLNITARIMDAGHGGQILVSASTAGLVRDHLLVDLGQHHLKGLEQPERVFQVGRGEFPPLRTPRQTAGNLPVDLSTFIGRSHEVKGLVEELAEHRLVTLIGVGGTGKTRLAIETGLAMASSFPDGCWMVELAVVNVEDAVPFAFASGLGVITPADSDVVDDLVARLRYKQLLIVVDNCEHVLPSAADAVERIVAACANVAVLATSREPLMVRGERLVPVASLPLDDAERLFIERARAEAPDLVIDAEQSRAVGELCQRLDGLPLAVELAASRVRALTPVELVANLEERFRLLVGGRRSRMERHQTMRGTLDWSYDLCNDVERSVFDRLAVFPAGFDGLAARAVASGAGISELDIVDVVPQLVDRSLIQRSTASDGTTRFRMLETMRAYGREHLQHQGLADTVRGRHAHYMAKAISALSLRTHGPDEDQVARRLTEYFPDALVALEWCIDHHEWDNGLRLTSGSHYLAERERHEMMPRLHDAARAGGAPQEVLDELARNDERSRLVESSDQAVARGWRALRSGSPIPTDRSSFPPQADFNDGGLPAEDVDEFLRHLDRWTTAPDVNRYFAEWMAIRALAHSGHLSRIDEPLNRFAEFVARLNSKVASRGLAELRGTVARVRRDWTDSARWYEEIEAKREGPPRTWFDLAVVWHLLTARALSEQPFTLTGVDLREGWTCCRNEHLDVLKWLGATATAAALQRVGHVDLAERFVAWACEDETIDARTMFSAVIEDAGVTMRHFDHPLDLDELLTELFRLADDLDASL
jgi:predicted ATPase/class 3 adenylate cyclase